MNYRGYTCNPQYSEKDQQYFGKIEGLPEAGTITAPNIDDFIKIYHQTVDDYAGTSRKSGSRNKGRGWAFWIILLGIIVAAIVTCPDKQKHVSVLAERITQALQDEPKQPGTYLNNAFYAAEKQMVAIGLDSYLTVNEYFLFSIGKWSRNDETKMVTVGAFNHIFTLSVDQLRAVFKEQGLNKL